MRVPSLTRAWPLPLSSFCASLFRDATLKNRRITRSICLKYGAEKCNGLTEQNVIVGEDGERGSGREEVKPIFICDNRASIRSE